MKVADSFFSLGITVLDKKILCATHSALEALNSQSVKLQRTRHDETQFDALTRATMLTADAEGNIPNVGLLPAHALIICTAKEVASFPGRWTFVV